MKLGETSNQRKAKFGVPRNAHFQTRQRNDGQGNEITDHHFSDKSEIPRPPPICVHLRLKRIRIFVSFVSYC
jgi:hypothetical protein